METATLNYLLATGILALQVISAALVVLYFVEPRFPDLKPMRHLVERFALWKIFSATLLGSLLALYYSEVLGFIPCGWCWIQRVFFFPMPFLTGVALWKNETRIHDYIISLALPGLIASLYQHYLQMGGSSLLPCPASGQGDCGQRIIFEYGYITFPLMATTLFAYVIVLCFYIKRADKRSA